MTNGTVAGNVAPPPSPPMTTLLSSSSSLLLFDVDGGAKDEERPFCLPVVSSTLFKLVRLSPKGNLSIVDEIDFENLPVQTFAYDLQPTNEQINLKETTPAVCEDTQAYNLNEEVGDESPRPASETMEVVPASKLAEELEDIENAPEETTNKQQVEVIIDREVVKEAGNDVQMDTDLSTTDENNQASASTTKDEEEETTTVEPPKAEVPTTTPVDLNKSLTESAMESELKSDETVRKFPNLSMVPMN